MSVATRQYRLVKIFDVREWDVEHQEYYPLEEGQESICERCQRKHVKVYVVEDVENHNCYHVGSGCCQRFLSWEPTKEEIKAANAKAAQAKKIALAQFIQGKAQTLIEDVLYRVPGKNCYDLRLDMANYVLAGYGLNETVSHKVFTIAKKAFK